MVRSVVWSQAVLAVVALGATLADQGTVPRYLFPPQAVIGLCVWSALLSPVGVVLASLCRKPGSGRMAAVVASVGLALATLLALLPLVA